MAGCIAWLTDALLQVRLHAWPHAELAFLMSAMFAVAWLFYRQQTR
jgi:hypothetical protein